MKQVFRYIEWIEPESILSEFNNDNYVCFLHSTLPDVFPEHLKHLGKYSFLSTNPFIKIITKNGTTLVNDKLISGNPFDIVSHYMNKYKVTHNPELPPMQGGAMGWFGYELGTYIEDIQIKNTIGESYGDMMIGIYDWVIAFDHQNNKVCIIVNGFDGDANTIIEKLLERIKQSKSHNIKLPTMVGDVKTLFSKSEYESVIQEIIDYIYAGDVFQVNITQPFFIEYKNASSLDIYLRLSDINPAPFSAYMNYGNIQIVSRWLTK